MDEIVVALLEDALSGISTSMPIYANVVPVHGTFPCMRYELMATNPFHTKDGSTADKYYLKVDFISKEGGLIGAELKSSAFDYVYSGAIELIRFLESHQPSGDLVGFRVNNIVTDFEFESNVFYITFDLDLFINKIPQVTMFSLEPAKVGKDTIGGKQVWVQGEVFDFADFENFGGIDTYVTAITHAGKTIVGTSKYAKGFVDVGVRGDVLEVDIQDHEIGLSKQVGSSPTTTMVVFMDLTPYDSGSGYVFIYYTID